MSSSNRNNWVETEVKREIEFDDFVNKIIPNTNTHEICGSLVPYHQLLSPEFSCFGNKWCLQIVFIFKKTMLRKVPHVGLYLRYLSDKSIMIGFNVDIIHSKGKKRLSGKHFHEGLTTFDSCRNRMSCIMDSVFGTPDKFLPLRSLLRCLVDGTLILKVTMRALGDPFTMLLEREVPSLVVEDCPICMEPMSKPWGVVTPCGHPFHLSCWDQVVAKHSESDEDDDAQLSYAVCRKVATGFQPVFLDLGRTRASTVKRIVSDSEEAGEEGNSYLEDDVSSDPIDSDHEDTNENEEASDNDDDGLTRSDRQTLMIMNRLMEGNNNTEESDSSSDSDSDDTEDDDFSSVDTTSSSDSDLVASIVDRMLSRRRRAGLPPSVYIPPSDSIGFDELSLSSEVPNDVGTERVVAGSGELATVFEVNTEVD